MEINITFDKTTRSPSKDRAIRIAKKYNYSEEGNLVKISFNEVNNDFKTLLDLIGNWQSTTLELDGVYIQPYDFLRVINCGYKQMCRGICLDKLKWLNPLEKGWTIKDGVAQVDRWEVRDLLDYSSFEQKDEKTFILNKEKLKEEILELNKNIFNYCDKINKDKVIDLIDKPPNKFLFISREEREEQRKIEMEKELEEAKRKRLEELNKQEFGGFTKYELGMLKEKAKIQAKELAKELKKILEEK